MTYYEIFMAMPLALQIFIGFCIGASVGLLIASYFEFKEGRKIQKDIDRMKGFNQRYL